MLSLEGSSITQHWEFSQGAAGDDRPRGEMDGARHTLARRRHKNVLAVPIWLVKVRQRRCKGKKTRQKKGCGVARPHPSRIARRAM